MKAVAEFERLRWDPETFDKPGAQLESLDRRAVAAWRETEEERNAKSVNIRLKAGVEESGGKDPELLLSQAFKISSMLEPREACETMLLEVKKACSSWMKGRAAHENAGLMYSVATSKDCAKKRPRAVVSVAVKGEISVELETEEGLESALERQFETQKNGKGKGLTLGTDLEVAGSVLVCIRIPGAPE